MADRKRSRSFGTVVRRESTTKDRNGKRTISYLARYTGPDLAKYSRTFMAKVDAEGWLNTERGKIDRDHWSPPLSKAEAAKQARAAEEEAAAKTLRAFADRYLADPDRDLRPSTRREYGRLLHTAILPTLGERRLDAIGTADLRAWRAGLDPSAPAARAAAHRLLITLLRAAEADGLIDRAPAGIRGASTSKPRREIVPATLDELVAIADAMPERLRLLVLLAADVGLREGELLELRRTDVDGVVGTINVSRKIEKDRDPSAPGACSSCGRVIGPPKTAKGRRTVHVAAPFLPLLRAHLLAHAGPGEQGLLFPGERTDHMSVRYLMDRFRAAREAAGRPDLTIHHLRHTALTTAGQHGATAAELQARAGHASQAAMALHQHGTRDRDAMLAERMGETVAAHGPMSAALDRWAP